VITPSNTTKNAAGKISFTSDVWSDSNRRPYLALTAHWIVRDEATGALRLKAGLIAFHDLPGSHTGKALAVTMLRLIDRAGATLKIGHFTLDNASNNDAAMHHLAELLQDRDIPFDPVDRRIRCFPHIINICVKHVIEEYTLANYKDVAESWVDSESGETITKDDYLEALRHDPVALGRSIVRVIRASGLRRHAFRESIKQANVEQWFKDPSGEVITMPVVELLRDVDTRWDSVYFMINRLRYLQQVKASSPKCKPF
jgi:hypothetical protein